MPSSAPQAFCQTAGHQRTTVNAVVAYLGQGSQQTLWKLLVGRVPLAGWTGPKYPNGTQASTPTVSCGIPPEGDGCLYNLNSDPHETHNLAASPAHAQVKTELLHLLLHHNSTTFSPDRGQQDPKACTAARKYGGYWGPWVR